MNHDDVIYVGWGYLSREIYLYIFPGYIHSKARRKDKDSTSGPQVSGVGYGGVGGSGFGSNEEGKGILYLETALLERHMNETDLNLKHLVEMPMGLEENEWMASHSMKYTLSLA